MPQSGQPAMLLYVSRAHCPIHWDHPTAVGASPLVAELIGRLDDPALPTRPRRRTEAVLFDMLTPVAVAAVRVPIPRDARAADVARTLLADPADGRNLAQWGWLVGQASGHLRGCSSGIPTSLRPLAHAGSHQRGAAAARRG